MSLSKLSKKEDKTKKTSKSVEIIVKGNKSLSKTIDDFVEAKKEVKKWTSIEENAKGVIKDFGIEKMLEHLSEGHHASMDFLTAKNGIKFMMQDKYLSIKDDNIKTDLENLIGKNNFVETKEEYKINPDILKNKKAFAILEKALLEVSDDIEDIIGDSIFIQSQKVGIKKGTIDQLHVFSKEKVKKIIEIIKPICAIK